MLTNAYLDGLIKQTFSTCMNELNSSFNIFYEVHVQHMTV